MEINLIIDTREKKPLCFDGSSITKTIRKKLDTGDYSVEGLEDTLFIERKGNLLEFCKNITKQNFWDELERAKSFPYKFLLAEFELEDILVFPYGCGLSRTQMSKIRITSEFILKRMMEIMIEYQIQFIFTGDRNNSVKVIERIVKSVCKI